MDDDDCSSLAKQILSNFGMDRSKKIIKSLLAEVALEKENTDYIGNYMLTTSPNYKDTSNFNCFQSYIHYQALNYALDFNDIILFAIYILLKYEEVRLYWQDKLNYVMVDEVQDCNRKDWEIMEIISERYKNLFVVGDPDQAIYEWRGARPDLFINWKNDKELILAENYRSTPNILDVANCVISNNKSRIPKDLYTQKSACDMVVHFHAKSDNDEAVWIVNQIEQLINNGANFSDFAILFRASYVSRAIEQELIRKKMTYVLWGGTRFFERKEIKDALCYLRLIASDDNLAFSRIVNTPSRNFGEVKLKRVQEIAEQFNISYFEALKQNISEWKNTKSYEPLKSFVKLIEECREFRDISSVSELLNYALKESGLSELYRTDPEVERLENIEELISSIRAYEVSNEDNDITLDTYLQDIALYTNADYKLASKSIKLMNVHQSKGLEFPYVFICGLSEGIFPSHRSIRERKISGLEEERRLMYVAITRAERKLFLTEAEGFNYQTKTDKYPSRFLTEIKKSYIVQEGRMDEDLWNKSKLLCNALDQEIGISIETTPTSNSITIGSIVRHEYFGKGKVIDISTTDNKAKVRFGETEASERYIVLNLLNTCDE
jgi:DNA helicase-2/ATP-dependent DNA helicase PcrA